MDDDAVVAAFEVHHFLGWQGSYPPARPEEQRAWPPFFQGHAQGVLQLLAPHRLEQVVQRMRAVSGEGIFGAAGYK